ncbi:hypothetical protein E2C01_019909 [Portunus trituberculatus]|uniref:Uncharacterized protein n=1 Tax=Portunus trituberculatus TaxID=210409 RepID=A0A5B7DYI4_PORTR|nr:hypothetical protein [Portunus trituberculatus]
MVRFSATATGAELLPYNNAVECVVSGTVFSASPQITRQCFLLVQHQSIFLTIHRQISLDVAARINTPCISKSACTPPGSPLPLFNLLSAVYVNIQ